MLLDIQKDYNNITIGNQYKLLSTPVELTTTLLKIITVFQVIDQLLTLNQLIY
jgi:hypothetical protein